MMAIRLKGWSFTAAGVGISLNQTKSIPSTIQKLCILLRPISTNQTQQHSFTVSYLINSCGVSPEAALSASKYINFETPEKPNSVLALLKAHDFSKSQISHVIGQAPQVLGSDPQRTLLPKLDFFRSVGFSEAEIAKIISAAPSIFKRSLKNQLIPSYNYFKNLLGSHKNAIAAIKRFSTVLLFDLDTYVVPKIEILRQHGVPDKNIVTLLTYQPRVIMTTTDIFKDTVEDVKKMGFNPLRLKFVLAIHAKRAMNLSTWERKIEVFKKWGWSEEDVLVAFGKNPWCLMASEDKIMRVMNFLVNEIGFESSSIVKRPAVFTLSLEKRIVPRCSIIQILVSRGLLKRNSGFLRMLDISEKDFLKSVTSFCKEDASKLVKMYREKLRLVS
ncbi:Transcription termination factor, mitochondrial/chloroplastic [Dillenia turbinata]|uniref:Transcription termination factor, mitochondrial/chloroplastic n=1 Tax=Dillenia turbinata TaxID=194707 RepID=A0AAN8Z9M4_9MAGN